MNEIWNEVWKALVLIIFGMLVLRLAGRKSISQMTIPTTIAMISIGTIIVEPIADHHILITMTAAAVFIAVLIAVEWLQLHWSLFERLVKGPAVIVIKDGRVQEQNLKKLCLTLEALEMNLREQGISRLSDVKTATIEPNGMLGYELQDAAKPVTLIQVEALLAKYMSSPAASDNMAAQSEPDPQKQDGNLFDQL
ncbi:membrane protein [Paenibacillus sp. FSL R7-0273]|uniref:DUF421 domain-containing protein n=1 Tax=Paenibacillus sp. FSL R7-0273 TaxID=1536772 RepID=UPI0004F5D7F1|nr:DUF421 domain-containing protein [Paenibacillus sp. FSL R7-0273]AIQ49264.1 membrane protein [Paenibacillus sp. FSL R7-0273]OMF87165.1 hypothetical protein BK144_24310 [Paenibacillus sp. FSL R7-0273]